MKITTKIARIYYPICLAAAPPVAAALIATKGEGDGIPNIIFCLCLCGATVYNTFRYRKLLLSEQNQATAAPNSSDSAPPDSWLYGGAPDRQPDPKPTSRRAADARLKASIDNR